MDNNFNLIKLNNLVNRVKVGFVGTCEKYYCSKEEGFPIIRTTDLIDNGIDFSNLKYITKEFYNKEKKSQLNKGDLLIARHGDNGKAKIYKKNFPAQALNVVIIEPNQDKMSSYLLKCFFETSFVRNQIFNSSSGSIQNVVNTKTINDLLIPISTNINYKIIGKLLEILEYKVELNNQINQKLEAMVKTLYDYWFVQFDFPNSEGKPYKSSGGKMVYSEELKREIPEGWEVGIASDLFDFNPKISLSKGYVTDYIDMNALPTDGFMTKGIQKKVFNGGVKFQNGDLVIARITPCLENGKTGLITLLEDEIGFGSTEFIVLRGKKIPLSGFSSCLSRSELFRKYAIANMTGTSGRKRVDAKALEVFSLAIPIDALLEKFEKIVNPFFKKTTVNTKENQKLTQLRDWLLPMLMNGQVKV